MQSNITTQCESQMRGYTMQDKHTVLINREPSQRVLDEMLAALIQTRDMGSRKSLEAIYRAVVNHGAVRG